MPLYSVFPSECKTALSYGVFVVSSWETCNRGRFWTKDLAHQMGPTSAPGDQSFNKGININQGMEWSVHRATKQFNEWWAIDNWYALNRWRRRSLIRPQSKHNKHSSPTIEIKCCTLLRCMIMRQMSMSLTRYGVKRTANGGKIQGRVACSWARIKTEIECWHNIGFSVS
jgi:hypothetical protein